MDALRVRYGDVFGEWHGGSGGKPHSCDWGKEDRVIIVQVHIVIDNTRMNGGFDHRSPSSLTEICPSSPIPKHKMLKEC